MEVSPPVEVPATVEVSPPVEIPAPVEVSPPVEVPAAVEVSPPVEVPAQVEETVQTLATDQSIIDLQIAAATVPEVLLMSLVDKTAQPAVSPEIEAPKQSALAAAEVPPAEPTP